MLPFFNEIYWSLFISFIIKDQLNFLMPKKFLLMLLILTESHSDSYIWMEMSLISEKLIYNSDELFTGFKMEIKVHSLHSSVQFSSTVESCPTLCDPKHCNTPGSFTNSWSFLKLMSIESVMPSKHLILCHPLLLTPWIFPSIRIFSKESVLCIRWPKYWSFSFSISPFKEYSGLISFRMDWLDLLAVQGSLKSLFQHHSSKASILWHSTFFIVQLSHPYMTTGKTIASTGRTFVGKAMCLLFIMLSRLVIAFLPRSKCLNFMAAVTICSDLGAPQNKVSHCFHFFPIYLPWSEGTRCHDLSFLNVQS